MSKKRESVGRKMVSLPKGLWKLIEDYRFDGRFNTEAAAIRDLLECGLKVKGYLPSKDGEECAPKAELVLPCVIAGQALLDVLPL